MTDAGYEILSVDDLDRYPSGSGSYVLRPLRRRVGFQPFGVNVWEGEREGDHVVEPHSEPDGTEELYVVLRGRARFTLAEEQFEAPVGTLVHAPPATFREAVALEAGTLVLAMGGEAGKAYAPAAWEDFFVAFAELRAGNPDAGRVHVVAALAREPDRWQGPFNAACFEALARDPDAAFEHLRRAATLDHRAAKRAADGDRDLDALRDDPRYAEAFA